MQQCGSGQQWCSMAQRLQTLGSVHCWFWFSWNLLTIKENIEHHQANPLMDLTLTHPPGWTDLFWRENCLSHARAQQRKARYTTGLIFWLLPIVVDTQVHCLRGHLSGHTYSSSQQIPALHGTANRVLYTKCIMATAQQRDKQQNKCPCVISHFITISRYLFLRSISPSLCYLSLSLFEQQQ